MKKISFFVIFFLILVIAYAAWFLSKGREPMAQKNQTIHVIYENGAFNPNVISFKAGDTAVFLNRSKENILIESDPHPIHNGYSVFDSGVLAPGASYEFMFNQKISFSYHNHLNPSAQGRISVE